MMMKTASAISQFLIEVREFTFQIFASQTSSRSRHTAHRRKMRLPAKFGTVSISV